MSPVISVHNLGKKFILSHQPRERYTALRDVMANGAKRLAHKLRHPFHLPQDDPAHEEFWALKDVSFDIRQGDRVGIIGRNGAGKSTLLKVLSRITEPTTGKVKISGRVASLLEVGTGFHPELTGRENIFLNGAILGMSRAEIGKKFDEIVAFAEVEKFLDTPVKRYSSGMYVRLAFAVAAHLEPEILIVDEVLAVGDAQFQKKCLGKMQEVGKEGRTVLFVSHNMGAVRSLCSRAVMLNQGQIVMDSDVNSTVERYLSSGQETVGTGTIAWNNETAPCCDEICLQCISLLDPDNRINSIYDATRHIDIEIQFQVKKPVRGMRIVLSLLTSEGTVAFASTNQSDLGSYVFDAGTYRSSCRIPPDLLNSGLYWVNVHFGITGVKVLIQGREYLALMIEGSGGHGSTFTEKWPGVVAPRLSWTQERVTAAC
jgi:homopolymeric O-antigen transport system ATP-binding protein